MTENPFGEENKEPTVEPIKVVTKRVNEEASETWDKTRKFNGKEVLAALESLGIETKDLKVTQWTITEAGELLSIFLRTPKAISGYYYELSVPGYYYEIKGVQHQLGAEKTTIGRIDYAGPDSDDVDYSKTIADFTNDIWVKQ